MDVEGDGRIGARKRKADEIENQEVLLEFFRGVALEFGIDIGAPTEEFAVERVTRYRKDDDPIAGSYDEGRDSDDEGDGDDSDNDDEDEGSGMNVDSPPRTEPVVLRDLPSRRNRVTDEAIHADDLTALMKLGQTSRDLQRTSVELHDRKPTFYTYLQGEEGVGMARLFTGTPQTEQAQAQLKKQGEDWQGSEFSLMSTDVGEKPGRPLRGPVPDLDRTRLATTPQGPHSIAHVLIEELLKDAVPDSQDLTPRQRWERLEHCFVTQVDTPEDFLDSVRQELEFDDEDEDDDEGDDEGAEAGDGQTPDPTELEQRIGHALTRHQEMFNDLEFRLNYGLASMLAAEYGQFGPGGSDTHATWLAEDLQAFRQARNLLAEIMEMAPFGSYAWQREGGATAEELKGKGERRKKFLNALKVLRAKRGLPNWREALTEFAQVLAGFVDGASGKFASEEAYKSFLTLRLELIGEPEDVDILLAEVLKFKA